MATVRVVVRHKARRGSGNWNHKGRPGLVGGSKGGPGSGNWGHSGRPSMVGGSGKGWQSAVSDKFISNYQELVKRYQMVEIPSDFEAFTKVAPGIKSKERGSEGFGLCAYHSINAAKENPDLDVYVGITFDKRELDRIENTDLNRSWGIMTSIGGGTVHVWNVDPAGKVIDHALGSRYAGDLYLGRKVDISKFANDAELLNYAHNILKEGGSMSETELTNYWNDWNSQKTKLPPIEYPL